MSKVKIFYLSPPDMGDSELNYIQNAFDTNWIAPLGPYVDQFEKLIAQRAQRKAALALVSGTSAIHLCLRYLGVEQDDYVFCSDLTFMGSCSPILYQKANPVFIDAEPESWNMSPIALQKAFDWAEKENKMPKAVIIVDLYGQSADYDKLLPICKKYNVPVIEDSAEALGATYKGKPCGSFGDFGIFSFNGNKIITTSGGGMVVSDNEEALEKMLFWATQARDDFPWYEHTEYGYNYRMSNICAAIGVGQMEVLDDHIANKKRVFELFSKAFENTGNLKVLPICEYGQPNYWLTVIKLLDKSLDEVNDIVTKLFEQNIHGRSSWKPMHMQPIFKECNFFSHYDDWMYDEFVFEHGMCLPSGSKLTDDDVNYIASHVLELL